MIFKGEISKYHPADAMMFLSQLSLNGELAISCDDRLLTLGIKDGKLIYAHSGRGDEKLIRCLRFKKIINDSQAGRLRQIKQETSMPVRQILGELKLVPLETIKEVLEAGIQEVLLELFLLSTGTFLFTDISADMDAAGISLDSGALSIRVLTQADEFREFEKSILSLDRRVQSVVPETRGGAYGMEERVVRQLATRSLSLRQIIEKAPFNSYRVMQIVAGYLEQGAFKLSDAAGCRSKFLPEPAFDPLFSSYKQALKMLVRSDQVLKKLEAVISFCKHHYSSILLIKTAVSSIVKSSGSINPRG